MTQISKKAYKGLPVNIKVRKPHYYYQDFLEVFNDNTEKYIELREFEGLDYSFNRSQVTFDEKVLWNGYTFSGCERLLAPSGDTYLTKAGKLVYNVVGSPTIVDNVVSNFSSSNYITTNYTFLPQNNPWVWQLKFMQTETGVGKQWVMCSSAYNKAPYILILNDGKIEAHLSSNNEYLYYLGSPDFVIELNKYYWMRIEFNGVDTYYFKYSTDGQNYITIQETNGTGVVVSTDVIRFGKSEYDTHFRGYIDFNETFIEINNEVVWGKDALNVIDGVGCLDNITDVAIERTLTAFVKDGEILLSENSDDKVGYTWANKVTIPQHEFIPVYKVNYNTIGSVNYDADFNASNFSASNYLVSKDMYKLNEYSSWSIEAKVKINTLGKYQFWCQGVVAFGLDTSNKIHVWCNNYEVVSSNTLQANTWYWVKLEFTSAEFFTGGEFKLYYKTNETDDWTECGNFAITTTLTAENNIYMGINPNNTTEHLYGIIDMKSYKVYGNGVLIWKMLEKV